MKFKFLNTFCVGFILLISSFANAGIIVTYYDDGTNLVFDYSGSWDSITSSGSTFNGKFISSNILMDDFYAFNGSYSRIANKITWTQTLGTGIFSNNFGTKYGSMIGDTFALDFVSQTNVFLYAPTGYVAGDNLAGTLTIAGTSIAEVGLADASYDFGQYGSVHFRSASVPEPSTLAIFALGMIGLASRRFKKQA
jgi:hypothetical protein